MEGTGLNLKISENDKQILKSVAPLVVIIILFVLVGKFGLDQINNIRNQINDAKKNQSVLSEKVNILKNISSVSVEAPADALVALPKTNPSLLVMAQINNLIANQPLLLANLGSSPPSESTGGMSSVLTSFSLSGTKDAIISFVENIDKIAPMSFVQKVDMNGSGNELTADISIKTYFAPLPKTIPTVTQAVTDLTATEKSLLTEISELTEVSLFDVATASGGINPNPFGI